ncbi:hypothetical protein [Desulfofustis limnaeus]|jgi:hypothetical protein|uniref:Uncharacterized protein n=1 Tax=Desulfofustis limnaeus TaxID=2740163 RepID=A0ABN6M8J1_9BACT|nr:hypothetical protein [Desulfofustis limnaeus]BDD87644.1 hypothetical protein DPPLL_20090 [Desulfofustis limnaeus]
MSERSTQSSSPPSPGPAWLRRRGMHLLAAALLCLLWLDNAGAAYRSRYVGRLIYTSVEDLQEFNDNLRLTRQLSAMVAQKQPATIEEEVLAKLDIIIEKVEVVLDMFPNNLAISFHILPDRRAVSSVYRQKYNKQVDYLAYYSLSEDTVYFSAYDATIRVVAHEIAHAVIDHFFQVRPPYNMHELMAQFAEKHVTD